MGFNLELDRAIEAIKKEKAKVVAIQLPDGLKPEAERIQDVLEEQTGCEVIIWAGSCYGACDLAIDVKRLGADMLIQWGHTEWKYGSIF